MDDRGKDIHTVMKDRSTQTDQDSRAPVEITIKVLVPQGTENFSFTLSATAGSGTKPHEEFSHAQPVMSDSIAETRYTVNSEVRGNHDERDPASRPSHASYKVVIDGAQQHTSPGDKPDSKHEMPEQHMCNGCESDDERGCCFETQGEYRRRMEREAREKNSV